MNERTETGNELNGRSISLLAAGDTVDEIEAAALDEARKVFGPDRTLEIVRNYKILDVPDGSGIKDKAGDKRYYARILIREPLDQS